MDKKNNIQTVLLVLLVISAFIIGNQQSKLRAFQKKAKVNVENSEVVSDIAGNEDAVSETAGATLADLANALGIDATAFETCLASDQAAQRVQDEQSSGEKAGVTGTPGNFLLDTQTGQVIEIAGAQPFDSVVTAYESLLAGNGDTSIQLDPLSDQDFVRGDRNARILLIEYSDYDCSFCGRFHATAQQIIEEYAGQIAWVYRQFPLDSLHPDARGKSIGAICAGQLGGNDAFWTYSDALLLN